MNQKTLGGLLFLGLTLSALWACGPWFPNWLLTDGDFELLRPPETYFRKEMVRLSHAAKTKYPVVEAKEGHAEQTLQVALLDLKTALSEQAVSQQVLDKIVHDHEVQRKIIRDYRKAYHNWEQLWQPWMKERSAPPTFEVPQVSDQLPPEFQIYFRGCIAYYQKQHDAARASWQALIELPREDRQFRSTWAAYMLGRLDVDTHPDRAITYFHQVRRLVDEGFQDSAGLAAASIGWEAKAFLNKGDLRRALELYVEQLAAGEETSAYQSILSVLNKALDGSPETLKSLAAGKEVRRLMTAYLTSRVHGPWTEKEGETEHILDWVHAVEACDDVHEEHLLHLALAVYQRGLYALSERLVNESPKEGILYAWLSSKLLLRKGKIDEAAALLSKMVRELPKEEEVDWVYSRSASFISTVQKENDFLFVGTFNKGLNRLMGEFGMIQLQRGAFEDALDALLRSGYWMDGAYLAERVLSTEELKRYVDRHWASPLDEATFNQDQVTYRHRIWGGVPSPESIQYQLRYLLARRLARENQPDVAMRYYPSKWREKHQQRVENLTRGRDRSLTPEIRAQSLWEAARITRYHGLELLGTELGPDWAIHAGNFEAGVTLALRQDPEANQIMAPLPEETRRVAETRLDPYERFHYRFKAADLAWDALALMPDNRVETARAFCEAGGWIKNRDPKGADRFYKALVRRCPETAIGQAAFHLHWFPKLNAQGEVVSNVPPFQKP